MQILKYFFLLFLLSLVAATIFIATQKGDFQLERSKILNAPRSVVFNYINDYQNWPDFNDMILENSNLVVIFSQTNAVNATSCSWEGSNSSGNIQTLRVKNNESIVQKLINNGTESNLSWNFKDTIGGTKVTLKTKGVLSFRLKVYDALSEGLEKNLASVYEKSLINLEKNLNYETNTFSIKVVGEVKKIATNYLGQTFSSKTSNINKNKAIVFDKILEYCSKNSIETYGKPFVIYHFYDTTKEIVKLSFCVPIKEAVASSTENGIILGKLASFSAIKTILNGDYSHRQAALDKTNTYFETKALARDTIFSHLEVYTIGKSEIKQPSKWSTSIYIPIKPKIILAPKIRLATQKTETVQDTIDN